jgi:hypothetical protein
MKKRILSSARDGTDVIIYKSTIAGILRTPKNCDTPPPPPRRYPYFDIVVGLMWSNDSESYDGGSLATGRASHARQVKGDDPDKPGPPGWRLGVG